MKLIFTVGVEGTGHHMVRAIFKNFLKQPDVVDEGEWHTLLTDYVWDTERAFQNFEKESKRKRMPPDLKANVRSSFSRLKDDGFGYAFESASFPFWKKRDALRRPDLIHLYETLGEEVEYKFIVLYRDPVSAAYSGVRRFTKNFFLQARIVEDNFLSIMNQCKQLPETDFRILHYEQVISRPQEAADALANWCGVDVACVADAATKVKSPTPRQVGGDAALEYLESFFTSRRVAQWGSFYRSRLVLTMV